MLNRGAARRTILVEWDTLRLPSYLPVDVRDLWQGKDLKRATRSVGMNVAPHAAVILKITPTRNISH